MIIRIKDQRELDHMRASADLVGRTLGAVARVLEPGVTTAALDRVAERFVRAHDAEPAFKGYSISGLKPFPGTLCVSVNDVVVHGIPGGYALQEGDVVSIDCGVRLNGYYGDSAYTFGLGAIGTQARALCQATYEALHLGIKAAQPGNRVGDIGHAVQRRCAGFGVVRELAGHGIGTRLHEEPQVPNVGVPGRGKRLRSGVTICIEPMINLGTHRVATSADGWTVRTADGARSAHYEHMVAIGDGGPEILTTFDYIEDVVEPPFTATYG